MVVGAGDAGQVVLRELLRNHALGYTPIGLVDDDPRKRNMRLHGVRVLGTIDDLPRVLREQRPDELLIAIPSASGEQRRHIVEAAQAAAVPVKTLPGLHELIAGEVNLAAQIRPIEVEDVLGREPVEVDLRLVASYLEDECVLVTGAGGSIGSELCRQIARLGASRIILLDHSEGALFDIERELVDERRYTASVPVLADVADRQKLRQVFEKYRPGVVFHAAAYKHVPLLEANPLECVRNNVVSTRVVADVAVESGVKRFVLVSTDKAASPKNIMGQSKAICEWIVEAYGGPPGSDNPVRCRPLRQRPRLLGQRHPDLPQADRPRKIGITLPEEPSTLPKRTATKRVVDVRAAAVRLDDPLAERLALAHDGLRVRRLVRRDEHEAVDPELGRDVRDHACREHVVTDALDRVRLHQRHVLVRSRVEDDRRLVALEDLSQLRRLPRRRARARGRETSLVDELALDLEQRVSAWSTRMIRAGAVARSGGRAPSRSTRRRR